MTSRNLRTNLAKAKGLGSSNGGAHHWLMQRITAVILIPCAVWLFFLGYAVSNHSMSEILLVLQKPYNIISMMLFVITCFYHAALGMQVVIEDYVHNLRIRYSLIIILKIFCFITIISCLSSLIYLMVL